MAVAALVLVGAAGAQTKISTEEGDYQLLGCYVQNKQVLCDVTFTLTSENQKSKYYQNTSVFSTDGTEVRPIEFVYAGKVHKDSGVWPGGTIYKGIPVKLTIMTGLAATSTSVRALILDNGNARWDNIAVRSATVPAPVAATATINIAGNWTAALTNCKQNGATVVCIATLRK